MFSTRVRSLIFAATTVGLGTCIPTVQAELLGSEDYDNGSGNTPGLTYTQGSTTLGEAGSNKAWSFGPVNWIDTTDVNSGSVFVRALVQRERGEPQWGGVSFFADDQSEEIMYFGTATSGGSEPRGYFGLHDQESGNEAASGVSFDVGTTHLMVAELDIDGGVAKMWIDPAFGIAPPTPDLTVPFAMNPVGKEVGAVRLNASGDPGFIVGDEVFVGTNWNDVVPTASDYSGIRLLAMTGNNNEDNQGSIYEVDPITARTTFLTQLTAIPDAHRITWNPMDGLSYHFAGNEAWSNDTTSNGYRDHQYLETYNGETEEIVAIFNANPPPADPAPNDVKVFGLESPTPDWVLPIPRRTVDQTDSQWRIVPGVGRGESEYNGLRDLVWAQAEQLWYGTDEHGLFKVTPDGDSVFVGRPDNDPETTVNESNKLKGITLVRDFETGEQMMIVGMRQDIGIYEIDTETAQVTNRIELTLVDENGIELPPQDDDGILALAQHPANGTIYGISRNPADAFRRKLFTLDVETGIGTVIGELTTPDDDGDFASLTFSGWIVGDINGDGDVNGLDVDPFVDVLLGETDDRLLLLKADINGDNVVNGLDVDPFVEIIVGDGGVASVPEPSTLFLALVALGAVGVLRRTK